MGLDNLDSFFCCKCSRYKKHNPFFFQLLSDSYGYLTFLCQKANIEHLDEARSVCYKCKKKKRKKDFFSLTLNVFLVTPFGMLF